MVGAVAIVLLVVLGLSLTVLPVGFPALGALRLDCTVGIDGTRASLTARGLLAGQVCRRVLAGTWGLAREVPAPAAGTLVVCSGGYRFGTMTVRDAGLLELAGRALCLGLAISRR